MKAIHLQTEYLFQPLGLGIRHPRFYWHCEGGVQQTAYQIVAKCAEETVWDSGMVHSSAMTHILYDGRALCSRERVVWSVRLWDEHGQPSEWAQSWFELGLLEASDWVGKWICGNYKPRKNMRYGVDCFRKEFFATKQVQQARLYMTAMGCYEARINGQRVGDFCLAPGATDYRKRVQYQVYDITSLLQATNQLEVQLADGWYRGSVGCFGLTNVFGRQTKLLCQLEITYADGTLTALPSDESFAWCNDGPLRFADLKDGEVYDAGQRPSYASTASLVKEALVPTAANNVFPKEKEVFPAKLLITPSGKKVLDFGQNIAGFLEFTVKGEKGQPIKLTCGEILDEHGEFTQKNMQVEKPIKEVNRLTEILLITGNSSKIKGALQPTPKQEVLFVCSGQEDHYKTAFAVFGFRYALLETEVDFDPAQCRAVAVYSDLEQTGTFTCSNEKINQLFRNTLWSMKGNFLDVPTDCPTRERLGWTGDAQIFFRTSAYLMQVAPFFRKWLADVQDNQFKNGKISAVVPYNGAAMMYDNTGASVGWGDAAVLLPYGYWKCYGDARLLRECYPLMRAYAMFMCSNTGHKSKKMAKGNPYNQYTYEKGIHLGEWLEPEEFMDKIAVGHSALHTEECTAYLHYTMRHMVEVATALEETEDVAVFAAYAQGAKNAYQWLFLRHGAPDTDRQAKLVRPLALGLAEGAAKAALESRLVQAVENRQYRIATGFLSTPFVLRTLTQMGRADLAYKMLENEQAPGWLHEVNQGATTIWESWEGTLSQNHYSPGAVCQWLFDTVAGVQIARENHFVVAPIPGGSLNNAACRYSSLYGTVESRWERTAQDVQFVIVVPSNTTAEIVLPDGITHTVAAGEHWFSAKI